MEVLQQLEPLMREIDQALHEALGLAHGAEARYLPGWSGVVAPQS